MTTTTSDVLNKAADLIEERGWGSGPEAWDGEDGSGLCIEGAILAALGISIDARSTVLWTCPAYVAVADYLDRPRRAAEYGRDLWKWNDEDNRTASEVIEVLRACAVIEASRERSAAEVAS